MKIQRIDLIPTCGIALLALLAALSGAARAAPGDCAYPEGGTGMGGTGMPGHGSGMGGTGMPELAGNVIFSQGAVEAQSEGRTRQLAKGAAVCVGETIVTSQSARAQLRMADGGLIAMRPDTRIRIDAFHFDGKEDGTERSAIALLGGGFRALTGLIGHFNKENYKITTPNATIGVRGTDHEPTYIPNPAPGQAAAGAPGTYDKVNSGGVVIRTPQGEVDVKPNQVGFMPAGPGLPPVILREMPSFYRAETGGEAGFRSEPHDGHEAPREPGERMRREPGEGAEMRTPELRVPEIRGPEVTVPEAQAPEMRGPGD